MASPEPSSATPVRDDAARRDARPATEPEGASDDPRVERWEHRFFWPVLVAALASVPAMFLTVLTEGAAARAGEAINYVSMAVFAAETVVLVILARDTRAWLRRNWLVVAVTALTIPAVLLALGPVQVLRVLRPVLTHGVRLVRFVGALRIIRVARILKAAKILYRRTSVSGPVRKGIALAATLLAATFVGVVLADEGAQSRQLLVELFGDAWLVAVVAAGLVLGGATFVVARSRGAERERGDQPPPPPTEPTAAEEAPTAARRPDPSTGAEPAPDRG